MLAPDNFESLAAQMLKAMFFCQTVIPNIALMIFHKYDCVAWELLRRGLWGWLGGHAIGRTLVERFYLLLAETATFVLSVFHK